MRSYEALARRLVDVFVDTVKKGKAFRELDEEDTISDVAKAFIFMGLQ